MTAPRVKVSIAFVRNLGNYETARIELGVERDVPENKTYLEALDILYQEVTDKVVEATQQVEREAGKINVSYRRN